jgi:hypothetical protein
MKIDWENRNEKGLYLEVENNHLQCPSVFVFVLENGTKLGRRCRCDSKRIKGGCQ